MEKCTISKFYATSFRGFFDPGQILSLGSYLVPLGLELICYAQHTNIHGNLNDLIRATFKAFLRYNGDGFAKRMNFNLEIQGYDLTKGIRSRLISN